MRVRRLLPAMLLALIGAPMTGCTLNDHFAADSVQYNREAEQSQDQIVLLNILRASRRRPYEFSGVQTISGVSSAQGQIGFGIPFALNGAKTAAMLNPTLTKSGGPTVSASILDTQEFYQGLLTPVTTKLIDYYVQRNLPKVMLFDLFFLRIEARQMVDGKPVTMTFPNSVDDQTKFGKFQDLLKALVAAGLTTDEPDKPKTFGPLMTAAQVMQQPNIAAKLATAGLELKAVGWCDVSADEKKQLLGRRFPPKWAKELSGQCKSLLTLKPGDDRDQQQEKIDARIAAAGLPPVLYRAQKSNTDYRLCFDLETPSNVANVCHSDKKLTAPSEDNEIASVPFSASLSQASRDQLCKALNTYGAKFRCDVAAFPVEFSFAVRSTDSIVYYLGEIVREALYPDAYARPGYVAMTYVGPNSEYREPLFKLSHADEVDTPFLKVEYDGQIYAIDEKKSGRTNEVLNLVNELLALNKVAKDVPTTNVITAIGVP